MNLFINAISKKWILILFDNSKQILEKKEIHILWNESSKLTKEIDDFLEEKKISYKQLENIVVVNWPWSFTWIRIISLIVNTIAFANKQVRLTPIDFFSLFQNYPIIKSSSKRDLFVKYTKSDKINIVKNEDFLEYTKKNNIEKTYWDVLDKTIENNITIDSEIDYEKVISEVHFDNKTIIEPLYIKKPNIT